MSYCRFINADAYAYPDCDGYYACMGCRLLGLDDNGYPQTFKALSLDGLAAHLRAHREAGHSIPDEAFELIEAEKNRAELWPSDCPECGAWTACEHRAPPEPGT